MKYLFIAIVFTLSLYSSEKGEALYFSCKFCHGLNGEKVYADTVPQINSLDLNTLEMKLKLYKKGLIDEYGFGGVMKQQMQNIPENGIKELSIYIKSLKK
tara:strand:+ start:648 stop:947 length:300 start_codon:yes stop_codon:yes gene_type:complete